MVSVCFLRVSKCQWYFSFTFKSSSANPFSVMTLREAKNSIVLLEQLQEMNGQRSSKNISRFRSKQVLERQTETKRCHLISKQTNKTQGRPYDKEYTVMG